MIFSSRDILTDRQLQRLFQHKYNSSGHTLLDPIMQKFWEWFTSKLPYWLAPNLMTLVGLIINVITTIILVSYSPDAKRNVPSWSLLLFAFGLFIYQTLDACDGKQARRTGSNSPLGELFDHGCDSLSTIFVCISVCIASQLGYYPGWMFYQAIAASTLFYTAHWQTYVTATLRFNKFDVTEVQFTVMLINIISAIWGPSIWSSRVPIFDCELKLIPTVLAALAHFCVFFKYFTVILTGGVGKNGSTVAGTSVLSPFINIAIVVVPAFIIYQKSSPHLYEEHPCLYLITFTLVIAKVTNKLVVAHMTRSEMDYLDSVLIGPAMLFLNQYFNTFLPEYFVLWVALVFTVADIIHYSVIVCLQISQYLRISVFKITPSSNIPGPPKSIKSSKGSLNDDNYLDCTFQLVPLINSEEEHVVNIDDEEIIIDRREIDQTQLGDKLTVLNI